MPTFDTWKGLLTIYPSRGLTKKVDTVFCFGHCHSLAVAINEIMGWPLIGEMRPPLETPQHVLVLMPDGRTFDARGPHERLDTEIPVTLEEIRSYPRYKPLMVKEARKFAILLLQKHGFEPHRAGIDKSG